MPRSDAHLLMFFSFYFLYPLFHSQYCLHHSCFHMASRGFIFHFLLRRILCLSLIQNFLWRGKRRWKGKEHEDLNGFDRGAAANQLISLSLSDSYISSSIFSTSFFVFFHRHCNFLVKKKMKPVKSVDRSILLFFQFSTDSINSSFFCLNIKSNRIINWFTVQPVKLIGPIQFLKS